MEIQRTKPKRKKKFQHNTLVTKSTATSLHHGELEPQSCPYRNHHEATDIPDQGEPEQGATDSTIKTAGLKCLAFQKLRWERSKEKRRERVPASSKSSGNSHVH